MKKQIVTLTVLFSLILSACGDRNTSDKEDIKLKENKQENVDGKNMTSSELSVPAEDLAAVNSAKKVINDYFTALGRGDFTEAYESMAQSSDRGTSSEFAEKHASVETATVDFTDVPEVSKTQTQTEVKLPLRYTIKTKNGNTETYNGTAQIVKGDGEDAKYLIQGMTVSREDS